MSVALSVLVLALLLFMGYKIGYDNGREMAKAELLCSKEVKNGR